MRLRRLHLQQRVRGREPQGLGLLLEGVPLPEDVVLLSCGCDGQNKGMFKEQRVLFSCEDWLETGQEQKALWSVFYLVTKSPRF